MHATLMLDSDDLFGLNPFHIDDSGDLMVYHSNGWVCLRNDTLGRLRNAVLTDAQRSTLKSAGLM